ncbi:MAG: type II toxin-antitoxin system RatA family toxin [Deltaproteobacteria bacterium]
MAQASRSLVIAVPIGDLFRVVTDFDHYSEFIPEMRSVRTLRSQGAVKEVEFEIEVAALGFSKRIRYALEFTENPPTGVRWRLTRSDFVKGNEGSWSLRDLGNGKTEATYQIELTLGLLVPKAVSSFLAEQSLPRLLDQFKRRAESRAGPQ